MQTEVGAADLGIRRKWERERQRVESVGEFKGLQEYTLHIPVILCIF
jgi:hypothetical protein